MLLRFIRERRVMGCALLVIPVLLLASRATPHLDVTRSPVDAGVASPADPSEVDELLEANALAAQVDRPPAPAPGAGAMVSAAAAMSGAVTIEQASAGRADHLAGISARDAGQYAVAVARFAAAAAQGGLITPVARLREAQALVSLQRREDAARAFAAALADPDLPEALRAAAITDSADNLRALNRPAEAIALLARLDTPQAPAGTRASARWAIAKIRRAANDPAWAQDARAALDLSTGFGGATEALDALFAAQFGVPRLTAALVSYRAGRDADARRFLTDALNDRAAGLSASDAALAWFYIGAIDERTGRTNDALTAYQRAIDLAPGGPLADDAMYWRADLFGSQDNVVAQVLQLDRLVTAFPASSFAADARLRAAVETGRAGRVPEALGRLEAITRTGTGEEAAAAARWYAVLRTGGGTPSIAAATFDPTSLGAILDRSGVDVQQPLPAAAFREVPGAANAAADLASTADWMARTFGPRGDALPADVQRRLAQGFELVAAGEDGVGRTLLSIAIAQRADHPHELLDVARVAGEAGLPDVQMQAAETLLDRLTPQQQMDAPKAVLRLAYPVPYGRDMLEAAQQSGLPVLLLFALVRQESAFYARAGSSAGAFGLAQLMPGTAADIAKSLELPAPTAASLADPAISLRFGAYYLGTQLRAFDGNVPAALSAYNGGPGNARRWQQVQAPRNFDGLVWTTDFGETRRYMERVLTNYAWYRYLYAGAPLSIR